MCILKNQESYVYTYMYTCMKPKRGLSPSWALNWLKSAAFQQSNTQFTPAPAGAVLSVFSLFFFSVLALTFLLKLGIMLQRLDRFGRNSPLEKEGKHFHAPCDEPPHCIPAHAPARIYPALSSIAATPHNEGPKALRDTAAIIFIQVVATLLSAPGHCAGQPRAKQLSALLRFGAVTPTIYFKRLVFAGVQPFLFNS